VRNRQVCRHSALVEYREGSIRPLVDHAKVEFAISGNDPLDLRFTFVFPLLCPRFGVEYGHRLAFEEIRILARRGNVNRPVRDDELRRRGIFRAPVLLAGFDINRVNRGISPYVHNPTSGRNDVRIIRGVVGPLLYAGFAIERGDVPIIDGAIRLSIVVKILLMRRNDGPVCRCERRWPVGFSPHRRAIPA
jgi:hypothetical protein